MNRRTFLRNSRLIGLSAAVSAATTYVLTTHKLFAEGYYVQMGTSVTAGAGVKRDNITPRLVGDKIRVPGVNAGFPGACAGLHKFHDMDPDSLCNLVDAIISGDWSSQTAGNG